MIKLSVGYSDRESEMQILDNSRAVHPVENLTAVTDKTELLEMMNRVENIKGERGCKRIHCRYRKCQPS